MNSKTLRMAYWLSLAFSTISLVALAMIDERLKTASSPLGIVSFELCAYTASCEAIVSSWQGSAQAMAAMSLGLDYLFMTAYPAAICCGLLLCKTALPAFLQRVSTVLAISVWIAGLADAVENYHLYQMLIGQASELHAWPASIAATIKFVLLVPPLLFWLASGVWHLLSSNRRLKQVSMP